MDYLDLCKYVFSEQVVDWEIRCLKSRKRELVLARQISIYLGNWFWPKLTDKELTGIFNQDHALKHHALKTIKSLLFSDKELRKKMDKYLNEIRQRIKEDDIKINQKLIEEESFRKKLLDTIDSMEIVARVYADIKGLTIK